MRFNLPFNRTPGSGGFEIQGDDSLEGVPVQGSNL